MDVCYKILGTAIEKDWKMQRRKRIRDQKNTLQRLWHIDEHLDNEDLSIVSVATHVYLNWYILDGIQEYLSYDIQTISAAA